MDTGPLDAKFLHNPFNFHLDGIFIHLLEID